MKRGVVMSIHKQYAVVMTADGQFLQTPVQGPTQIGEEVTFEDEYKKPVNQRSVYWYGSAAALILIFLVPLLFFIQRDSHSVVAYVSMDINPSVELGVDENEKVRELRALNEDGEVIIKGLKYAGVHVEEVAATILERAKGSHYLDTPNKDIFITSVLIDDNFASKLDFENILTGKVDEKLKLLLSQLEAEAATATITTLSLPNEVREEAALNGISSGKMAVYLMAKDEGYNIELEQLKQQSIDKATASIGGVKTIVDKAEDKSKEKLKKLVAQEKEEKAKQKKEKSKANSVKPSSTPNANKPVKAEKPNKPVVSGVNKDNGANKPNKNGTWGNKPVTTPGKPNKPTQPNGGKNDSNNVDKNNDKDDDKNQNYDRNNNDDDDDSERNDNRNRDRNDNNRNYDRYSNNDNENNYRNKQENQSWKNRYDDKNNKDWKQNKDKGDKGQNSNNND
jgi:hypothetical protein